MAKLAKSQNRKMNNVLANVLLEWERIAKQNTGLKWHNTDIQEIAGNALKKIDFSIYARALPKSREKEIIAKFKFKKNGGLL